MTHKKKGELFDIWPEKYDHWFTTPIGTLVKKYEAEILLDLLKPKPQEIILDAGCGTGVFTLDFLYFGTQVVGIDISLPMLIRAGEKARGSHFETVLADISHLPFSENSFDKAVSVTTLEFIEDAKRALEELFRVTKKGGTIVVATLNSLSPWATRRKAEAKKGHALFKRAIFRSPDELLALVSTNGVVRTAIHFERDEEPKRAMEIELEGQRKRLVSGAFVAVRWEKP